jgi:hypothetical protein
VGTFTPVLAKAEHFSMFEAPIGQPLIAHNEEEEDAMYESIGVKKPRHIAKAVAVAMDEDEYDALVEQNKKIEEQLKRNAELRKQLAADAAAGIGGVTGDTGIEATPPRDPDSKDYVVRPGPKPKPKLEPKPSAPITRRRGRHRGKPLTVGLDEFAAEEANENR